MKKAILIIILVLIFGLLLFFLNGRKNTQIQTTQTPEIAKTPSETPLSMKTPISTSNPAPTPTPTASPTFSPEPGVSPTAVPSASPTATPTITPTSRVFDIFLNSDGVSPQNITIQKGDTVRFTNNSNSPRRPASDIHPIHNVCPGFDAKRSLSKGETYSFTFNEAKECPYHDHLNAGDSSFKGKITII